MMMSGDGYREHDQFWVTNDGDNIESNSIILINQRCYSMRQLLLNKSLCLKLFFLSKAICRDHRGRDRIVAGFITNYAISAYHY
jgi:hypothetical protein